MLGLQVFLLCGIVCEIVQLNQRQLGVLFCVVGTRGAPATGAGAEGELPLAAPDGKRAVDRVVNRERPCLRFRLAKQRGQK